MNRRWSLLTLFVGALGPACNGGGAATDGGISDAGAADVAAVDVSPQDVAVPDVPATDSGVAALDAGDIEVDTISAAVNDDEANAAAAQGSASVLIGFGIFGDGFE